VSVIELCQVRDRCKRALKYTLKRRKEKQSVLLAPTYVNYIVFTYFQTNSDEMSTMSTRSSEKTAIIAEVASDWLL